MFVCWEEKYFVLLFILFVILEMRIKFDVFSSDVVK